MTDEVSVTRADIRAAEEHYPPHLWRIEAREDLAEALARHRIACTEPLAKPLLTLVNAMREYLPSDGISKDEFVDRIIHALDNPEINPVIAELEGR